MRQKRWKETEKLINRLIQKNMQNKWEASLPEVEKVKDQLANFKLKSL